LTALGSLGDLHPYIAIGLGLRARGHDVVIATGECYRRKVEALGLEFRAARPDSDWTCNTAVMRRYMAPRTGTVRVVTETVLTALREAYEDTRAAAAGADLLVSHPLTAYATRLVAETTGVPWASTAITPLAFFSIHDPSVFPLAPVVSARLRCLGPAFWGPLFWLGRRAARFLARPWYRLRAELGLRPAPDGNPLVDSHSPDLVLALFSGALADKQPDWPARAVVTGFPIYDRDGADGLPPHLNRFLDAGPPPIVFTLGHSAAAVAGAFFEQSAAAALRLGRRAVIVVGHPQNRPVSLPDGVTAVDYAPFSELFPRAAAVVHAGGIGTTGLAMRAGRPVLVVPFAHDQWDNAARAARRGVGRTVPSGRYRAARVTAELGRLLEDPSYARRAAEVGETVRREDGAGAACDALEGLLRSEGPGMAPGEEPA